MDLKQLSRPLDISNVDFRIQSINKGGYATILAYKDARVDMQRLDEVCGPLNWKRQHARDNQNCIVSIWCNEKKEWISKEDTGAESFTEKEKGLASDSFKRACFNWGIGRELYDYPLIRVKLNADEFSVEGNKVKQTWNLRLKDWSWVAEFDNNTLFRLVAIDQNGIERFKFFEKINLTEESSKWDDAIDAVIANGLTIEQVRKGYNITNINFKLLTEQALERAAKKQK